MEALTVEGLSRSYGDDLPAADDIGFSLGTGQFGVLLGPSGAGKTTILKMIAGILLPDVGRIELGGQELAGVPPEHRDIAMVFENYALYPHMSVRKNIEFPLRAPRRSGELTRRRIDDRVLEVATTLRIDGLLDRMPSQLSGGQRQRVSLGRALARRPRLLLLDEPITHLDAKLRHEMRTELKRIQRELGVTTLYATPDQGDAMALADVVIVLASGRTWQIGSPTEVFEQPDNVRVAQSLGDPRMNLLDGTYRAGRVNVLGLNVPVADLPRPDGEGGSVPVVLGIRPANVELSRERQADAASGRVVLSQNLGYVDVVHVETEDGVVVRAITPSGLVRTPGQPVWLRIPAEHVHVFAPGTGHTLLERTVV